MTIKILPNTTGSPAGKVAEAELHFTAGPLAGLKLIGFAVWERKSGQGLNVTYPARNYSVNGERRSFALLRPSGADLGAGTEPITELIRAAYLAAVAIEEPTHANTARAAAAPAAGSFVHADGLSHD
jgi:hypothetical protein